MNEGKYVANCNFSQFIIEATRFALESLKEEEGNS